MMYSSAFFRVGMVLRETQKRARELGMVLMAERKWLARAGLELDLAWVMLWGDWALSKCVLYGLAYFFGRKWKMLKKVTGWNDVGQLCFLKRMWLMQKIVVFLAKGKKQRRVLLLLLLCGESVVL
jgi:hypothetical protein